ncbi:BgtA-21122 [Blumeria graminis f. sp. tritici]|uniref:BgtA-21122 n=2 Tax=Blumeria graminis f. sp. tritici TaxID=62690 RepID=A0A9X9MJ18_BLUGR|nr:hypothetical protein BGT96224_A21122 [Blumeria graminis f. sp. tritici 96224]VDB89191.1 BgtA-21122 [Blumeria graminis f. sp. tritici]
MGAQNFVETYYPALNNSKGRLELASFYVNPANASSAKPDITINGHIIPTPNDLQKLFETQVRRAHYDIQSYDAHVLNSNYNFGQEESLGPDKDGKKISITVMVSGSVRYWMEGEEGDTRGFTESIVLVPNKGSRESKIAKGTTRKWLILSQTFRLIS